MVELRWVDWGICQELEYRTLRPTWLASGAWGEPSQWSEWERVPSVEARVARPDAFTGKPATPEEVTRPVR